MKTKLKSEAQVTGEEAVNFLKYILPKEWTIREFNPDYGIDLDIELFGYESKGLSTLGEHVFAQVKGTKNPNYKIAKINGNSVDAISFSLEVSELNLIERMGSAIPVLLIIVDLINKKAYQICLNDYIKKVLPIQNCNYRNQDTVSIYIPVKNVLPENNCSAIEWYGKRIKIYSMFHEMLTDIRNFEYKDGKELVDYAKGLTDQYCSYDLLNQSDEFFKEIKNKIIELKKNDFVLDEIAKTVRFALNNDENWKEKSIYIDGVDEMNAYLYAQNQSIKSLKETIEIWSNFFEEYAREKYMPIKYMY